MGHKFLNGILAFFLFFLVIPCLSLRLDCLSSIIIQEDLQSLIYFSLGFSSSMLYAPDQTFCEKDEDAGTETPKSYPPETRVL